MLESPANTSMTGARYALFVVLFAACYILLDWLTFLEPLGPFNLTPWNPQPALAIVWMTLTSVAQWPVVFLSVVLADVVVRDAPAGYAVTAGSAFIAAAGYATISFVLKRCLRDPGLNSRRDLAIFTITVVCGVAVIGVAFVNALAAAEFIRPVSIEAAWLRFWIGDASGILVTGPLAFAVADHNGRARLGTLLRDPLSWIEWALVCVALVLVFQAAPADVPVRFCFLFAPVIWIAARSGMHGAIVATMIIQLGIVFGLRDDARHLLYDGLELFMCFLCVSGLFIAGAVDQRRRSRVNLTRTQRVVAE